MGSSGELTILPGALSTCVLVDIISDSIDEDPETFQLTVTDVDIPALSDQTLSGTFTILDTSQL